MARVSSVEVSADQLGTVKRYENPTPAQIAECDVLHQELLKQRYWAHLIFNDDPEAEPYGNPEDWDV